MRMLCMVMPDSMPALLVPDDGTTESVVKAQRIAAIWIISATRYGEATEEQIRSGDVGCIVSREVEVRLGTCHCSFCSVQSQVPTP